MIQQLHKVVMYVLLVISTVICIKWLAEHPSSYEAQIALIGYIYVILTKMYQRQQP